MLYKLAIAMREDLDLSCGKIAVQAAHASVECVLVCAKKNKKWLSKWKAEGGKKVVLRVTGEEELRELERKAKKLGLVTSMIYDAGLTEVEPGTLTCLGIGPAPEDKMDVITGNLRLW